jgi:hypothetical protein
MTINDILPRFGHAGGLARAVPSLHHNRDTRACGERRFGNADFWLHLIMVDTDDPRAAPPRGLLEATPPRLAPRKKKIQLRENFRFRFRIRSMQRQDALRRGFS